jgi:hypothetical protein
MKSFASSTFALQLDESTDVANLAELLVYVRYAHGNFIVEKILFCKPYATKTTGFEIFNMKDSSFC